MESDEYNDMRELSKRKSEEDARLKWERDTARKHLRRGRSDYYEGHSSWAADGYADGTLRKIADEADAAFGYRKQVGLEPLLNMQCS